MTGLRQKTRLALTGLAMTAAVAAPALLAAEGQAPARPGFAMTRAMIPMRDGVKLHTVIFVPKDAAAPLPFLLMRTPYGVPEFALPLLSEPYKELVAEGYIFVFQDIRGRYKSEGHFVMQRPPHDKSDPQAIDESTDAYDTVDWLVKNVPGNNGRAGLMGISYGGWLTAMAMLDP
ncbi:MAG TPA: CocE/NonD family hydrolase, partial [Burkholderiales bacterium]|nr:CocE/NonD family hydrolase [Burkholderiales bacterium]